MTDPTIAETRREISKYRAQAAAPRLDPDARRRRPAARGRLLAALAALTLAAGGTARGQDDRVSIKVSELGASGRQIEVAVNKAVLVDFNTPFREVRTTNADIAEVAVTSPRQLVLTGISYGTTQLIVWLDEEQQEIFDVSVNADLKQLELTIQSAVPRARVRVTSVLDRVMLTGTAPDTEAAERVMQIAGIYSDKVINQVRVAGVQQVLLRVTVAEVNRSAIRQLGFNGWIAGDNFHDMFAVHQLDGINPVNIGAAGSVIPIGGANAGPIPFATDVQGLNLTNRPALSFGFPRVQMQVFIQALRENGLLRILAEPNLVAINGQDASFLAGGEIPIPIATDEKIKIDYKEFGVRLHFTPTVLSEDSIRLRVSPEISEPDFSNSVTISGISVPGFTSRRVETVVEIGSGQTFAIGGLLSERSRGVSRKIPGLGDVPILGPLFSSVEYQKDTTEFVVLVTPELVEPVTSDQITSVPGDKMLAPNDFELFLLGKLEGEPTDGGPALQPRVNHTWPVRPEELYGPDATMKVIGPVGPAGTDEGG